MSSFVPSQHSRLIPARSYSSEAWEQKRMIISQLYRDEARSLNNVLVVLAQEHDFRPTPAMLKKRITKWSLDRKRKQLDMLVALRLASQREALGKETIF
ncbi:uncharacterized protein BDZ99DRAFT_522915 [Mytilinidion resinicola]|uniref:Clr5 domain-containing protein n=1 Tax=Mytilinidion resinicola TaxID=574789 RepID=A0A6A6YFE2_9PEZI|nr:uncharacterized protein BDZ99DRAFT_522915 [Mytilinidion resinicola]KAF2807298.1 hypothetical protein BDZ99DRAFT_522915 [Mytilinidion resinicola]